MRRFFLLDSLLAVLLIYGAYGAQLDCEFSMENHLVAGDLYTCKAKRLDVTEADVVIESINGAHASGMTDADVKFLLVDDQRLNYLPFDIDKTFPNLIALRITSSGLKGVTQERMKQFPNLEHVDFTDNEIETLDGNLFSANKKLKSISFDTNKIKHIFPEVFDSLEFLESVSLLNNECIKEAWSTAEDIADGKFDMARSCPPKAGTRVVTRTWSSPSVVKRLNGASAVIEGDEGDEDYGDMKPVVTSTHKKITKVTKITSGSSGSVDDSSSSIVSGGTFDTLGGSSSVSTGHKSFDITCEYSDVEWSFSAADLRTCTVQNQPIEYLGYKFKVSPEDGESTKALTFNDNKNMKYFPTNIAETFPNLVEMSAKNTYLSNLAGGVFKGLGSLKKLKITGNDLKVIESGTFEGLDSLEELDLSEGDVQFIEEGAFSGLKSLKTLYLSGNKIHFLPPKVFEGLTNLEKLSIELNHLTDVEETLFADNKKLTSIWLNGNKINNLTPKTFEDLNELNYVDLQGNECIDGVYDKTSFETMNTNLEDNCEAEFVVKRTFKKVRVYGEGGEAVATAKLRNEYGEEIEEDDEDDDEIIARLSKQVKVVQVPGTGTMISSDDVMKAPEVVVKNIPSEKIVTCEISEVEWQGKTLKTCVINDQVIDTKSFKIAEVPDGESVKAFSIAGNKLVNFLPENIGKMFPNLVEFSAKDAGLKMVSLQNLEDLKHLKSLNLGGNNIRYIEPATLDEMTQLEELDLTGNELEYLEDDLLTKLKSLKTVRLGSNKLHFIHSKMFKNLRNLQSVSLSSNHLAALDENLFKTNQKLKNIWLHNNKIKSLSPNMFRTARGLEYVDLRDNKCIHAVYEKGGFETMRDEILAKCGDGYVLKRGKQSRKIDSKKKKPARNKIKTKPLLEEDDNVKEVGCEYENVYWPSLDKTLYTCVVTSDELMSEPGYTISANSAPFALPLIDGDTVEAISFANNKNFKYLPKNLGEVFPNLLAMSASNSALDSVSKDNFKNLSKLKTLNLAGNNIKSFESDTFEYLTSLEELVLDDNEFEYIEETTFTYLKRLKKLRMAGNKLKKFNTKTFEGLDELEDVSIEFAYTTEYNVEIFQSNPQLRYIKLNGKAVKQDLTPIDTELDVEVATSSIKIIETITEAPTVEETYREVGCNFVEVKSDVSDETFFTCEIEDVETLDDFRYIIKSSPDLARVKRFSLDGKKNIKYLPENFAQVFPEMREISVVNSGLVGVNKKNFEGLSNLEYINLRGNSIKHLEPDTFDDLYSLEYLDLSHNNMEFIEEVLFHKPKSLKKIYLSSNQIHHLHPKTFQFLEDLEVITLDDNVLSVIEPATFRKNPSLQNINLRNNKIESLTPKFVDGLRNLKEVDLTGNKCIDGAFVPEKFAQMKSEIKENCKPKTEDVEEETSMVVCDWDATDDSCSIINQVIDSEDYEIKLPTLIEDVTVQNLRFKGPNIKYLPVKIGETFPDLTQFSTDETSSIEYVTKENFRKLPKLKTLQLNNVKSFDPNSFEYLSSLEEFDLSTDAEEIDDVMFSYFTSMKTFYLKGKKLRKIHPKAFDSMTELEEIDIEFPPLEGDEWTEIEETLIRKNPKLKYIKLNGKVVKDERNDEDPDVEIITIKPDTTTSTTNKPEAIEEKPEDSVFETKPKVKCDYETIEDIDTGTDIVVCVLNKQTIDDPETVIEESTENVKVRRFTIKGNKNIKYLPTNLDESFPNLEEITVEDSSIRNFKPRTFKNLRSMKILDLSDNDIEEIDPESFTDLSSLENLDLGGNEITELNEATFNSLPKLKTLDLSGNNLKTLSPKLFENLQELTTVNLKGNDLPDIDEETTFKKNPKLTKVNLPNKMTEDFAKSETTPSPSDKAKVDETTTKSSMETSSEAPLLTTTKAPMETSSKAKADETTTKSSMETSSKAPLLTTTKASMETSSKISAKTLAESDDVKAEETTKLPLATAKQTTKKPDPLKIVTTRKPKPAKKVTTKKPAPKPTKSTPKPAQKTTQKPTQATTQTLAVVSSKPIAGDVIEKPASETTAKLTFEIVTEGTVIEVTQSYEARRTSQPEDSRNQANRPDDHRYPARTPDDPRYPANRPEDPRYPANRPEDPRYPENRPEDPRYPANRPEDPRYPANRPEDPSYPANRPEDPSYPANRPEDPRYPANRPEDPRYPANRPKDPSYPANRPEDPSYPANRPEDPSYPAASTPRTANRPRTSTRPPVTPRSQKKSVNCQLGYADWPEQPNLITCDLSTEMIDDPDTVIAENPYSNYIEGLRIVNNKNTKFLPENLAQSFPNLVHLSAKDSSLESIFKDDFDGLKKLKSLDLSGNNIEIIEPETFNDLWSLEDADLSNNAIEYIEENTFPNSPRLKTLSLKGNKINFLHPKTFENLPELTTLDLEGNNLPPFDESELFKHNPKLQNVKFTVQNRPISTTTERTRDSSLRPRRNIPCSYSDTHWYYANSNLYTCNLYDPIEDGGTAIRKSPRNINVKGLNIIDNKQVKFLPDDISETLPNLVGISAFNNSLQAVTKRNFENLPHVKYLNLAGNNLKSIDPDTFDGLPELEELDLTDNQIKDFDESTFAKLRPLKALYLGGNNIKHIPARIFEHLPNLRNLSLENNELTQLDPRMFYNNPLLINVWLNGNKLKLLNPRTFDDLNNLEYIDLQGNDCIDQYFEGEEALGQMRPEVLRKCHHDDSKVEVVTFRSDTKPSIPKSTTRPRSELPTTTKAPLQPSKEVECSLDYHDWKSSTLYTCTIPSDTVINPEDKIQSTPYSVYVQGMRFDGNKNVKNLPKNIAENFPQLIQFSAKNTSLTSIDPETLRNLPKLEVVDFSDNKIESIDPETFQDLPSLVEVNLNHNRINRIGGKAFPVTTKTINLGNNKLRAIDPETFEHLPNLKNLDLPNNDIQHIDANVFRTNPKLETISLSGNRIRNISPEIFENLLNLKSVDLEENDCVSGFYDQSSMRALKVELSRNCQQNGFAPPDEIRHQGLAKTSPKPEPEVQRLPDNRQPFSSYPKATTDPTNRQRQPNYQQHNQNILDPSLYQRPDQSHYLPNYNYDFDPEEDNSQARIDPSMEILSQYKPNKVSCNYGDTYTESTKSYVYTCSVENQHIDKPGFKFEDSPENNRVKRLTLDDNKYINFLPEDIGETFPQLEELSAKNSLIKTLRPEYFKEMPLLKSLDLSDNQMKSIDPETFDDLPSLEVLNLNQNHLKFIDEPKLEALRVLKLDDNRFTYLDPKIFSNLPELTKLDMKNNEISQISEDLFKANPKLETIDLSQNKLKAINPKVFDGLRKLQTVDFTKNDCIDRVFGPDSLKLIQQTLLQTCQPQEVLKVQLATCRRENDVCKKGAATKALQGRVDGMKKENDKLKALLKKSEAKGPQLTRLKTAINYEKNLSRKLTDRVKLLENEADTLRKACARIDENHNFLINLNCVFEDVLDGSKSDYTCTPKDLKVGSENSTIDDVKGEHKRGKRNGDVTSLVVSDQSMKYLPSGLAETFPRLSKIIITNSNLHKIGADVLNGLDQLNKLKITRNDIKVIEPESFDGMPRLEHLDLSDNKIKKLPIGAFEKLPNLHTIILNNNEMPILNADVIPDTNAIEHFTVNNNKLAEIDPRILKRLPRAATIDFLGNVCIDGKFQRSGVNDRQEMLKLFGEIAMQCSDSEKHFCNSK